MNIVVFLGPTLDRETAEGVLNARYLPPAALGDVYRASESAPSIIGIVDGYFEGTPAVWHKEILWAINQGICVFGSASMGALRATELHPFGMIGVGEIFNWYKNGHIDDDGDVSVVHGPAELGYAVANEPMVNVRATLRRALADGIIDKLFFNKVLEAGQSIFYPHRSWDTIFESLATRDLSPDTIDMLKVWLPRHRVDQKRCDALEMLEEIRQYAQNPTPPTKPSFTFENTSLWRDLRRQVNSADGSENDELGASVKRIVNELRLDPGKYQLIKRSVLLRYVLTSNHQGEGNITQNDVSDSITKFREIRGLYSQSSLETWFRDNGISKETLEKLVESDLAVETIMQSIQSSLDGRIYSELAYSGDLESVSSQLTSKELHFEAMENFESLAHEAKTNRFHLYDWYFSTFLKTEIPNNMDAYTSKLDFESEEAFLDLIAQTYLYCTTAGLENEHKANSVK